MEFQNAVFPVQTLKQDLTRITGVELKLRFKTQFSPKSAEKCNHKTSSKYIGLAVTAILRWRNISTAILFLFS